MLSARINGEFLDLPDDFSITFNIRNPVFHDMGTSSYPIKLPPTIKNRRILNFINRIESTADPYQEFPIELIGSGLVLFSGLLKCRIGSDKSIEGSVYEGNGDFFYQSKNYSLQNYLFGDLAFASNADAIHYANQCFPYTYPQRPVAFPQLKNDAYFEEQPGNQNLFYFNKYLPVGGGNPGLILKEVDNNGDRMIIVPFVYFRHVLESLFPQMGYTLDDQFFAERSDFNRMVLYNSVNANEDPATPFFNYSLSHLYLDYHIPRISLNEFFTGYENMFFVRHFVNNITKTIRILSIDSIIKSNDVVDYSKNVLSTSINLEDKITGFHLKTNPDSGDTGFDSIIQTIEEPLISRIKDPVLKKEYLPKWPAVIPGEIRFVLQEDRYYYLQGQSWLPYPTDIMPLYTQYVFKNKEQLIETKFSTINTSMVYNGFVTNKMADWADVSPRLFFALNNFQYVLTPSYETSNTSLLFFDVGNSGQKGLFRLFFETFLSWRMKTKQVKISRQFDLMELREFDPSKKAIIGGIKYLIGDIQVTLKKNSISPATMTCYPCL